MHKSRKSTHCECSSRSKPRLSLLSIQTTSFLICTIFLALKTMETHAAAKWHGQAHSSKPTSRSSPSSGEGSERPHIIVIVADDLGYNDVSFHGSDQIPTPNIDFLGYNGVILNNYYVSPICTPTRSALMTGRHPIHTGMQHSVIVGSTPYGLPLNETLLPQYLNKLGYRSHIVGKWHLGMFKWEYTPLYRGFESHLGYYQGCEDYYTHTYEANLEQWGLDFRRDKDLLWNCTGQYSTTLFEDEAVRIIERHNASEPLFLYLPFQAVHSGNGDGVHLQAPKLYIEKFAYIENSERRAYAAMVSALDDAVGNVYDTLKKRGMLGNSIIVFTTDNGGPANGFDYNAANNFPLRGVKSTLWEGGVRGVGLIHSPLIQHQGYVSNKMLHVCDWLPTLVSAAGGRQLLNPGGNTSIASIDGVDAWEMLSNDGAAVRSELLHNIDPIRDNAAIRIGDYKLIVGKVNMKWDKWYPPYQLSGDEEALHYLNFKDKLKGDAKNKKHDVTISRPSLGQTGFRGDEHLQYLSSRHGLSESAKTKDSVATGHMKFFAETLKYRQQLNRSYRSMWPASVFNRMNELYCYAEESSLYTGPYAKLRFDLSDSQEKTINDVADVKPTSSGLRFEPETRLHSRQGHKSMTPVGGSPVKVECGPRPANASVNCQPTVSPCLYHIASDPCEYNNIARWHTDIVSKMMSRLSQYTATMVPPRNKPFDPKGNPRLHGGAWVPWK